MNVMYVVCVLCSPLNLMDEVAHQLVNSSSALEPAQPKNDVSVLWYAITLPRLAPAGHQYLPS